MNTNMKKKLLRAFALLSTLCLITAGGLWWYAQTSVISNFEPPKFREVAKSNPWDAKCIGDIKTPRGYARAEAASGSYAEWLRQLPLKPKGSKVMLYTGGEANYQFLSAAVIDLPLLSNAEQCADMTMRLRAEYLYSQGRYSAIRFTDVNGNVLRYRGGASRKALEKYLRNAYGCCSTFSVSRETEPRPISKVKPGDVLVYPARKLEGMGHALIVVDVARKGKKVAIMCAEGNTPAREAHIVRNPNPRHNPWFFFDGDESTLWVSAYHFGKNELRHY